MNESFIPLLRKFGKPLPLEMKQWYFDIPAFKPEVGFTFQFKGQGKKGDEFVHRCEDKNGKTTIKVSFEVENMNSLELHRSGWQVIIG